MRLFFLTVGVSVFVFLGTMQMYGQRLNDKKTVIEHAVRNAMEKCEFIIGVDYAFPAKGTPINLTSDYTLEVRKDSVYAYLPYFGRAYNIPYGGGDGLIFEAPIHEYKAEYQGKGKFIIRFTATNNEDKYLFFLTVFDNGLAEINISPVNRQPISFRGNLILPAENHKADR